VDRTRILYKQQRCSRFAIDFVVIWKLHYTPRLIGLFARIQRVHFNHVWKSFLTRGVNRVLLYWSPSLRMASACVG